MTWILIIFFTGINKGSSLAVPGFATLEQCQAARREVVSSAKELNYVDAGAACVAQGK